MLNTSPDRKCNKILFVYARPEPVRIIKTSGKAGKSSRSFEEVDGKTTFLNNQADIHTIEGKAYETINKVNASFVCHTEDLH